MTSRYFMAQPAALCVTVMVLGGCAASPPDAAYGAFERGVREAAALSRAQIEYRTDEAWRAEDVRLHAAGAGIALGAECYAPLRRLQRASACAAGWVAHEQRGTAAPACERPTEPLTLSALPDSDGDGCALEVWRGDAAAPLAAPEVPLAAATALTDALADYASALATLADARDIAGIEAAITRTERTLGGLSAEVETLTGSQASRRAGPASGLVLNLGSLAIDTRRRAALDRLATRADPLVRDAALTLSYLLTPAYLDRLGELAERLDAALDDTRLAADDAAKFHRAMTRARRARARYAALAAAPPGLAMQAMADAHGALLREREGRLDRLEDAVDSARTLVRRARRAREAFVRE